MRIAMFQGYGGSAGFGALTDTQLSMADDAVEAAKRGRSAWEVWKPSIDEIVAMRAWLGDPRVDEATFNVFLQKCRDAMGASEWNTFIAKWAPQVNTASQAYDTATQRIDIGDALSKPVGALASAGKWIVIGLVAYAAIRALGVIEPLVPRRRSTALAGYRRRK